MKVLTLLFISVMILKVQAKNLASGLKDVNDVTSSSASVSASSTSKISPVPTHKNKKRHALREVILYLTPSQIKALEAGDGYIGVQSSVPVEKEEINNQNLKLQEQTEFVKQEFENLKSASIQQVEPANVENSELASQEDLLAAKHQQELDDQLRQKLANREEQLKLRNYYFELNKAEQLKLQQELNGERNVWFANSPSLQINEGYSVQEPEQEAQIVEAKQLQLNAISSAHLHDHNSVSILAQNTKPLLQLQYSPKYNDQEKAIEIEKILRSHHRHELEKQSALSQAETIANSPAILVHEQVKITKQNPVPVVKHVEVNVPTPVLVAVPAPVPIQVQHQYPLLHGIIKDIPVPIVQRGRVELGRPVPYNVESQISIPINKLVFLNVDRPYDNQRVVPVAIRH